MKEHTVGAELTAEQKIELDRLKKDLLTEEEFRNARMHDIAYLMHNGDQWTEDTLKRLQDEVDITSRTIAELNIQIRYLESGKQYPTHNGTLGHFSDEVTRVLTHPAWKTIVWEDALGEHEVYLPTDPDDPEYELFNALWDEMQAHFELGGVQVRNQENWFVWVRRMERTFKDAGDLSVGDIFISDNTDNTVQVTGDVEVDDEEGDGMFVWVPCTCIDENEIAYGIEQVARYHAQRKLEIFTV